MEYNINIDRKSFKPAYIQLVNILRSQIDAGKFRPGGRLPSESQLCKSYNVSPMTVRRAINILLQEGIVSTTQGRGTFVKPIELHSVKFSSRELQDIFSGDLEAKVKLLEVRIIKANADIASKLDIKPDTRIILIRRLIMKDMEPVFYHQEYLVYNPTLPIVESEMGVTALYGLFTGRSEASLKRGEISIKSALLSETEAHLLLVEPSLPSFRLEHIFYDFDNRPISWGYFLCRSDKINFRAKVGSGDTNDNHTEN